MCGIIGILGKPQTQAACALLAGLKHLEYRGYDSAGIALLHQGRLQRHRAPGKLIALEALQHQSPLQGTTGLAHIRWATHGIPNEVNAHPHMTERVALVHNGIIENYQELRTNLEAIGIKFESQTDTEVVLHLIDGAVKKGMLPIDAVRQTLKQIKGAYALAILFRDNPDLMIGARHGPPLAVGYGNGEMYLGSDAFALSHLTSRVSYLEDGDVAILNHHTAKIVHVSGQEVYRSVHHQLSHAHSSDKGKFAHYMIKEIHEQPDVVRQTLNFYLNETKTGFQNMSFDFDWTKIPRITIIACGTAFYAGMVAKYWFEQIAKIPVEIDIASEFRYRAPPMPDGGLAIFISQSGETADTLAAHRYAKQQNQHCLAIVNVAESSLARAADYILTTHAGPEIGVASTKAFTTQLSVLAILAISMAQARGSISAQDFSSFYHTLTQLPALIDEALLLEQTCAELAYTLSKASDVLYLGRGTNYALALEGALKLKEISYIHAEGYAAGELKHGPIALIDDQIPVIVIAPSDALFDKTISNVQEVLARKGKIIFISDQQGHEKFASSSILRLTLPSSTPLSSPLLYTLPIQMLAYHTAVIKGTDVDQPRNLAKSVTVE